MWPAILSALPGIISAAGGVAGLFGHKNKPGKSFNRELDKIPGQVNPYYQPYIDAGRGALNTLQGEYGKSINDPGGLYSELGKGYTQSPGYANKLKAAMQAAGNAGASGGMLGTPAHAETAGQIGGNIANQDFEQYMNHIMGIYNTGLTGEGDINRQGRESSESYGNLLGNITGQKGQNNYADTAGKNTSNASNWSNITGGVSGALQGYNDYGMPKSNDYQNNPKVKQFMEWLSTQGDY